VEVVPVLAQQQVPRWAPVLVVELVLAVVLAQAQQQVREPPPLERARVSRRPPRRA
jgi:hypothetical protein